MKYFYLFEIMDKYIKEIMSANTDAVELSQMFYVQDGDDHCILMKLLQS